jgi:hypothetical protein
MLQVLIGPEQSGPRTASKTSPILYNYIRSSALVPMIKPNGQLICSFNCGIRIKMPLPLPLSGSVAS